MREPDWTRDELILALDFYFRTARNRLNERNPEVVELARTIRGLPIHLGAARTQTFRSALSVKSKLENFHALRHPGQGLRRGGKLDRRIFQEFFERQAALAIAAAAIKEGSTLLGPGEPTTLDPEDEHAAEREGGIVLMLHRRRERSARLVRRKKQSVLRRLGHLACEACDIDFAAKYGTFAFGLMECHHTKPLSSLEGPEKTRLRDLALLCPNCHRAIHRLTPLPTISEFRSRLGGSRSEPTPW